MQIQLMCKCDYNTDNTKIKKDYTKETVFDNE